MSDNLENLIKAIDTLTMKDIEKFDATLIGYLRTIKQAAVGLAVAEIPVVQPYPLPTLDARLHEYTLTEQELYCCKMDRKIPAIKSLRERTGLGLADAKQVVEYQAARHGLAQYMYPYPGLTPKGIADHKAAIARTNY